MGRHSNEKKAVNSRIDDLRRQTIEEFFGLKDRVQKHIEWSLESIKPCGFCLTSEDGTHKPGRAKDTEGKCAFCHGTSIVPDVAQRNWATEEVYSRIAPPPKAVELIDKTEDSDSMEAELRTLSEDDFSKRLAMLEGLTSNGNGETKPETN